MVVFSEDKIYFSRGEVKTLVSYFFLLGVIAVGEMIRDNAVCFLGS